MNSHSWSPLGWTGLISFLSKGLARVFSKSLSQRTPRRCKQNSVCSKTQEKEQWSLQEIEADLPLSDWVSPGDRQVSSGLPRGLGLWQQKSWEAQHVAEILLEEVTINPTLEPSSRWPTNCIIIIPKKFSHCGESSGAHNRLPNLGIQQKDWEPAWNLTLKVNRIWLQNLHRTEETEMVWGYKKTFLHQGPGERSSDPTRDWARLASECSGVSSRGVGRQRPTTGSGTLTAAVLGGVHAGRSPFAGRHYHHYPYHSLASGQTTGRGHSPTHQQKISSKIY